MKLEENSSEQSLDHLADKVLPMVRYRIGSREFAINRRACTSLELEHYYDAVSSIWPETARGLQLSSAYQRSLLACGVAKLVTLEGECAKNLDCGIGSGTLSLPFGDQTFDVVMAAHALEHLPEPKHTFKEMIRVLKPDGIIFICMARRSFFGTLIQFRWRTWTVAEQQGIAWLQSCNQSEIGRSL